MSLALPTALLLTLLALLTAAIASAPPLRVDARSSDAARSLWGFYQPEPGQDAIFRWSGPQARMLLHGAPSTAAMITLRLSGERLVSQGTPQVRLSRGDERFATFDIIPGWRLYHVLLPPGAAATLAGDAQRINLVSAMSRPGASDDARDYRPLGVPLDWLRIARLDGGLAEALARSLLLCWAVGLAAAGGAWLVHMALPQATRLPATLASATIALLGLALSVWAWRSPYSLAWALPPTPWALGLLSLLLGTAALAPWRRAAGRARVAGGTLTIAGLGMLAVAQGALNSQAMVGPAIALALIGLLLLLATADGLGAGLWAPASAKIGRAQAALLLGMIVALALALRLYRIDSLPFGLWRDEARHGLAALRINSDPLYTPVYIAEGRVSMPALTIYVFALAIKLIGVHVWTMRLVTAIVGALTVLPVYALMARLAATLAEPPRSTLAEGAAPASPGLPARGVGLLAALLVAISSWQITISRFSFPTIFEPLLTWGGLWLLDRALRPAPGRASRPIAIVAGGLLAGACFGLAAQTYHIGRFAPLMGGLLALATLIERRAWRRWLMAVLPAALGCLLVLAPLLSYALRQPDDFNGRVSEVFVLGESARQGRAPLAVLDDSLRRHILMFNVEGDLNGRHHAPGRPMLDYITGLGFLLGMAALLRRLTGWRSLFMLAILGVSLLPSALALDSPHGMRAFEAAPLSCAIAALGMAELLRMVWPETAGRRRMRSWAASACLGLALALNVWIYFVIMPPDPEVFMGFSPVQSQMGVYVRDAAGSPSGGKIYVPYEISTNDVFAFLRAGLDVESFDRATLSAPAQPGDRVLISGYLIDQELADLAPLLGPDPRPLAAGPSFPDGRGPTFLVYEAR
ncbi:hypothetical protein K2Z83_09485 [Oscillochloris sp. ZM17-4]|uniref:hypothetical protein n=1 Tax=Oscillochloris sp. ZM17-4 TaxID=2866714 RepID=UPI001C736367|nr:hypothetical protein [Oscillochloris sp. ZM17-4]MBX0327905.1 hypothetical protein [Oscillochloris sp. ZM17-4]